MFKTYSSKIFFDGAERVVQSKFSEHELASLPLMAWEEVRRLRQESAVPVRLGTYLNCATACVELGRLLDAHGMLKRLDRETRAANPAISEEIQRLQATFSAEAQLHLPNGYSVIDAWCQPGKFKDMLAWKGDLFCNYMHPGAPYGGILGAPGLTSDAPRQGLQNASFHLLKDGRRIATVGLVIDANHVLGGVVNHPAVGSLPAEICFVDDSCCDRTALRAVVAHIQQVARAFAADEILVGEALSAQLGLISIFDSSFDYSAEIWSRPVVDLLQDETTIFSDLRKSYKSLVNWGKKNLAFEYFCEGQLSDPMISELLNVIQTLHTKIIQKYGDGMTPELFLYPMVACRNGRGEVALARDTSGDIVGMTVTTYENGVAYYALAGFVDSAGKSVGPCMVFDSIVRAKQHGMAQYVVNRFFPAPVSHSSPVGSRTREARDRQAQLIFFKRGFSSVQEHMAVYRLHAN